MGGSELMPSFKTILAGLIAALAAAAGIFRAMAQRATAQRDQARQQADIARQVNAAHAAADEAARKLGKQQRQETIDERKKIDNGVRDQLDRDW